MDNSKLDSIAYGTYGTDYNSCTYQQKMVVEDFYNETYKTNNKSSR